MGPEAILTLDGYPGLEVPLNNDGAMRISFAKAPDAFRAISAADVVHRRIDPSLLQNAWVIVGGTAFGMADIVPTRTAAQHLELAAGALINQFA